MTENNVMSIDELLDFIENKNAWDYYKFPAFYNDKYKLEYSNVDEEFLNSEVKGCDYVYDNLMKCFNYKARNILYKSGLLSNISQTTAWYRDFSVKRRPDGQDFINLCNFFLYLYEQDEEKFNLIAELVTSAQCSIFLMCIICNKKDRVAQFLANELLTANNNKIFNIIATLLGEAHAIRLTYIKGCLSHHIIFAIKKLNLFYNLMSVKDDGFKRIDEDFFYYNFYILSKVKYFPENYEIEEFKEKLKNNSKFREKIAKNMTSYFNNAVDYDYDDVNPFKAFCYVGFKLRPYGGLNKFCSYMARKFFTHNRKDISCFCYILLKYFNGIFANLIPDEIRDVNNKQRLTPMKIFNKIFEKCDYYEIFKFVAESPLKDEYPDEFYIEQFKAIDGMDKIFSDEDK